MRDSTSFLLAFGCVAYYFSSKMARLIILLGPIASALGGVAVSAIIEWAVLQLQLSVEWFGLQEQEGSKKADVRAEPEQEQQDQRTNKAQKKIQEAQKKKPKKVT